MANPLLIPAAIGAVGSLIGGESANERSERSIKAQMDFQERMSNTAHQREVKDLIAAGLNPALSLNSGASTPSGASMNYANPAVGFSGLASQVAAGVTTDEQKEVLKQQAASFLSQRLLNESTAEKQKYEMVLLNVTTEYQSQLARGVQAENALKIAVESEVRSNPGLAGRGKFITNLMRDFWASTPLNIFGGFMPKGGQ